MFKRNVALQKLINDHKTIATFKKQRTYKNQSSYCISFALKWDTAMTPTPGLGAMLTDIWEEENVCV